MEWLGVVVLFGMGISLGLLALDSFVGRPWLRRRRRPGPVWTVPCRDAAGRRHAVIVAVEDERIVLRAPAGQTATFDSLEVGPLRSALRDAVRSRSER